MGKDDYTAAAGGGALKLKGAKPSGIDKKQRKKKAKPSTVDTAAKEATMTTTTGAAAEGEKEEYTGEGGEKKDHTGQDMEVLKTEAERRHEEMRRRRLDDRLKREGLKTHKERVEELNKYLSNLSEHHDMPRIGPG